MLLIDDTVVNVALPTIARALHFAPNRLPWIVDAFMLTFGGFLVLNGRCADLFGRRRMFALGLGLFVVSSAAAGLAGSSWVLVAARGVQGLSGALIGPAALGMLVVTFSEGSQRRRALGAWGAVTGVAGIAGVILGGVVTDWLGWRWVFLINLPAGAVILLALVFARPQSDHERDHQPLDLPGAVLVTFGLSALVWSALGTTHRSWSDPATVVGLSASALALVAFVLCERRTRAPIVNLALFRERTFAVATACMLLAAAGMYSMVFFLTQYMQIVQGWSPLRTGLSWLPFGALFLIATGASIQLMSRVEARVLVVAGGSLGAAAQLMLLRTTAGGSYWMEMAPAISLMGAGVGLAFVPVFVSALHGHASVTSSTVSGIVGTAQQVGGAIGIAVLASLAIERGQAVLAQTGSPAVAAVAGFHRSYLLAAGVMAAVAALGLMLPRLITEVDLQDLQTV